MDFKSLIAYITLIASITAVPTPSGGLTGRQAQNNCQDDQVAACCNSGAECYALNRKILLYIGSFPG